MKGIPAIHLFTGAHVDYHKPSDDWERLNADGMAQVNGNYTERLGGVRGPCRSARVRGSPQPESVDVDGRQFRRMARHHSVVFAG
jgi:hypothetical protein